MGLEINSNVKYVESNTSENLKEKLNKGELAFGKIDGEAGIIGKYSDSDSDTVKITQASTEVIKGLIEKVIQEEIANILNNPV